jgi:transposase
MPSQQASPIHLSPIQHELLQRMVHRTKSEQRLVKRGHIILEAAQGASNTKIAQHRQVDYETVRRWRDRWHAAESRLQARDRDGKAETLESGDRSALER